MNGAIYDSTNMFFRLRYEKAYDGHAGHADERRRHRARRDRLGAGRGALYGLGFLVVMFAFGPRAVAAGASWRCRRRC